MPDAPPPPSAAALPPPDLSGCRLGDFLLLRRLGRGGMGQVYLARQVSLKRLVAIKFLRPELTAEPTALLRFQAEAEAIARLNHPNIVQIYQTGEQDGLHFLVLEYVPGCNLREYLECNGPPTAAMALSIIRQVATALQQAHEQGVIHRDIKPENILMTRRAEVKVTDFGLSRSAMPSQATHLTQSGLTEGTPLYMSPEQVQGQPADPRSDLYCLGVTGYHLLAGQPPFQAESAFDVARKHVHEAPRPLAELRPDLPAELGALVHRLMAKDPADRFPSARELLRELDRVHETCLVGAEHPAASGTKAPRARPGESSPEAVAPLPEDEDEATVAQADRRRHRLVVALACLTATASGAVLGLVSADPGAPASLPPLAAPPPGLLDFRPPSRVVPTRERELLALLEGPSLAPDDLLRATIELGLLYVHDRRFDEARDRFERLERVEASRVSPSAGRSLSLAGRLGQAVVLAFRDPAPGESPPSLARTSTDLIRRAVDEASLQGGQSERPDTRERAVAAFLLRHPDLARAVADALNRNMVTLGQKPPLSPPVLEYLRNPWPSLSRE